MSGGRLIHGALRTIEVILVVGGLLVCAVGGVRWMKRSSAGAEFAFGGAMLALGVLAILLVWPHDTGLVDFATRYTAAWCSHNPARVATFYSESGSLTINEDTPAVGRDAVEAAARSFMTSYPDLVVKFDGLEPKGERVLYHWTFIGTNTGPGGTGKKVRISGYEDWRIGRDGLIADSKGHYDAQEWDRQVKRH